MRVLLVLFALSLAPPAFAASPCRSCIQRPIRAKHKELAACYSRLLKRAAPDTKGRVVVRFTIKRSGRTGSVKILENELKDRRFGRCIARVFRSIRYSEKPKEPMRVSYPLVFKPKD